MMALREKYVLELEANLTAGRDAVSSVLGWLRVQGHAPATLKNWKLPLMEAVTNAIVHGCAGKPGAHVSITAQVTGQATEVKISDPGRYVPTAKAAELADDLLLESGRGGFLIAQCTDSFEHQNDASGHSLTLRWKTVPAVRSGLLHLADSEKTIDQLAAQLGDSFETVTAYGEFAALLATTADFGDLLTQVRARVERVLPHASFVLRLVKDGALEIDGSADGFVRSVPLDGTGLEAEVFAGRSSAALGTPHDLAKGDPLRVAQGPLIVVPVGCPKKKRGTLALVRVRGAAPFTAGQIAFAQAVADFVGTAQSLSELWAQRSEQLKLEQELQLAAKIQQQFLPQVPPVLADWNVAGDCRPSRAVGGDYFDWIRRPDGACWILVADVMGKGLPAAMVATILRSTWRTLAGRAVSPGSLLTDLNVQLGEDLATLDVFITAVLFELPAAGGQVTYANAGHCALYQAAIGEGNFRQHGAGGSPLGIEGDTVYADTRFALSPSDWLFAYTDGCYEYDRGQRGASGRKQFEIELRGVTNLEPAPLIKSVLHRLQDLVSGELPDDCTLIAVRRKP